MSLSENDIQEACLQQLLRNIPEGRSKTLIGTVLETVPVEYWDNDTKDVGIELEYMAPVPQLCAVTEPSHIVETPKDCQNWIIRLFQVELDHLSALDVLYVVAHELGDVLSRRPYDFSEHLLLSRSSVEREAEIIEIEKAADQFAREWGFPPDPSGAFVSSAL